MIPNDQPLRGQTIERMINHLVKGLDQTGRFTSWEEDFIQSIYEQFSERDNLSQKQCEILERIYDK